MTVTDAPATDASTEDAAVLALCHQLLEELPRRRPTPRSSSGASSTWAWRGCTSPRATAGLGL